MGAICLNSWQENTFLGMEKDRSYSRVIGTEAVTQLSSLTGQHRPASGFFKASSLHLRHLFGPELSYSVYSSSWNMRPLIPFLPPFLPICDGQIYVSSRLGHRVPRHWPNIIQDVSVRVFPNDINMWIDRMKRIAFPKEGQTHPINWKPEWNYKGWVRRNSSCLPVWAGTWLFYNLQIGQNIGSSWVSSLPALGLGFTTLVLVLRPLD